MDFIPQLPSVAIDEVCLHKEYFALAGNVKTFPDLKGKVNAYKTDQCGLGNKGSKNGEQELSLNSLPIARYILHLQSLNTAMKPLCLSC